MVSIVSKTHTLTTVDSAIDNSVPSFSHKQPYDIVLFGRLQRLSLNSMLFPVHSLGTSE